jgi:glycosyltransferase involved in cell wall biosynthesis
MPHELVSVVIPCRNQAAFLRSALSSVSSQTYARHETIVIDDGSTDDTAEVAASSGATVLSQRHAGLGAARNAGLRNASGEYVIFLDADDELVADAMATGVAVLARHPAACMVARCCQLIDRNGRLMPTNWAEPTPDDLYAEWLLRNFVWTPGAAMFRRAPLIEAGGFPASLGPASDYAVYLELARRRSVVFDRRDAVRYRQHDSNMSRDAVCMLKATLAVLRRERKRLPPGYALQYQRGIRAWRTFYGEQIVQQLRGASRQGGISRRDLGAIWLLVTQCRGLVVTHFVRKFTRVARGLPPAPVEPGRFPVLPRTDYEAPR